MKCFSLHACCINRVICAVSIRQCSHIVPSTLLINTVHGPGHHILNEFVCINGTKQNHEALSYLFCSLSHQERIKKRRNGVNNWSRQLNWTNKMNKVEASPLTSLPPSSSSSYPSSMPALTQAAQPPLQPVGGDSRWGGKEWGSRSWTKAGRVSAHTGWIKELILWREAPPPESKIKELVEFRSKNRIQCFYKWRIGTFLLHTRPHVENVDILCRFSSLTLCNWRSRPSPAVKIYCHVSWRAGQVSASSGLDMTVWSRPQQSYTHSGPHQYWEKRCKYKWIHE